MKKCKITVLKTLFNEDLASEYGAKGIGKCPLHTVGQEFSADWAKPDGFCDEAWKAIYQYVFALSHGSDLFYYGDWTVIRIMSPNNKPADGGYEVFTGKGKAKMSVSRENVAKFFYEVASKNLYVREMPVVFNR